MMLAQRLYEGVELGEEGSVALITYMRTDSVNVSADALAQVREHDSGAVRRELSAREAELLQIQEGCAGSARSDAADRRHRARRKTCASIWKTILFKLYQMIWQRFVASQMMPAVFDQTTIDISRRRLHFPRHWFGAEIRRLPARVPDAGGRCRSRRRREGRRRRRQVSAARRRRADPAPRYRFVPTSISPSRRRATRKRRW